MILCVLIDLPILDSQGIRCWLFHRRSSRFSEESDMQDEAKTKHQLIIELQELRDQVAELEKNRAEEALCESEARLRQIIDLVPHMIFVKDWDGKYLLVNKALAQAYNTSVSDLTGKYHADFHPDESELQKMFRMTGKS